MSNSSKNIESKDWSDMRSSIAIKKTLKPRISIHKTKGTVAFNRFFIDEAREFFNKKRVIPYFSSKHNAFVFEFTNDEENPTSRTISFLKNGRASIAMSGLISSLKLNLDEIAGQYTPILENIPTKGKVWIIELDEIKK